MTLPIERLRASLTNAYTIDRELGRGGMATVYLAQDCKHDRVVALKVLHPTLVGTGKERAQFLTEAQRLQQIAHPSVVKVLAVGELPDGRQLLLRVLHGLGHWHLYLRRETESIIHSFVATRKDISDPLQAPFDPRTLPDDKQPVFIFMPFRRNELAFVQQTYPNGHVEELPSTMYDAAGPLLTIYRVDK